jgi:hypothetical protein
MSCPFLHKSHAPQCRAVAGGPLAIDRDVVATYCRPAHASCPAFRFLRASGRLVHPADFQAWVVLRVPPGRAVADRGATERPDGA